MKFLAQRSETKTHPRTAENESFWMFPWVVRNPVSNPYFCPSITAKGRRGPGMSCFFLHKAHLTFMALPWKTLPVLLSITPQVMSLRKVPWDFPTHVPAHMSEITVLIYIKGLHSVLIESVRSLESCYKQCLCMIFLYCTGKQSSHYPCSPSSCSQGCDPMSSSHPLVPHMDTPLQPNSNIP